MKPFCFCFCLILSINDVTSGFQTDLNVDSRFLQLENTILEQGKMINDLKKTVENQNFENAELHRRIDKLEAYVRKELTTESINGQHRNVLTEDIVEEDIVEEDKNKTIRRELSKDKRILLETNQVAFYAYLSHDEKAPSPHFTVVFDTVETNIGNGYNKYTGAFVVPVAGTYVFSFSITCWDNSRVGVELMCNDNAIGSTTTDSQLIQDVHVGATTVVVILNQGDTCFLRTGTRLHSLGTLHSDYWSRSSFTGWKL